MSGLGSWLALKLLILAVLLVNTQAIIVYPTKEVVYTDKCLDVKSLTYANQFALYSKYTNRSLVYPDGTLHPVSVPYPRWASGYATGQIVYILISEVMQYSAYLFDTATDYSAHVVNYVAGCIDPDSETCVDRDEAHPKIHFTLESWLYGIARAEVLPSDVSPTLLSVLDYNLNDGLYLWQKVVDAGLQSVDYLALDDYRYYKASKYQPHKFFDPWQKLYELIPIDVMVTCANMAAGLYNDRHISWYLKYTNDTQVNCSMNDTIWFSPSCRNDTSQCIPVLIQYSMQFSMQLSFFLDMPFAVILVSEGKNGDYAEYFNAIYKSRFLFGYYSPNDVLEDEQGNSPTMLILPPTNELEQFVGLYRTGISAVRPRNYCWRSLANVDPSINYLVSQFNLYDQDIQQMMAESRNMQNNGTPPLVAARRAACDWLKSSQDRWKTWVPAICPEGSSIDKTFQSCDPCQPGSFCLGGSEPATVCPVATYCPGNGSAPIPCPTGRNTPSTGASRVADCSLCQSGYINVAGSCVSYVVVFPSAIIPAVAVLAAIMLAIYLRQVVAAE